MHYAYARWLQSMELQNICPASSQVLGRRFAQHPKFRFVAYNVLARSQAIKQSAYFLKKDQRELRIYSLRLKLRKMLNHNTQEAHSLLKSVNRYTGNMLETRPYWQRKRNELTQVCGLGCPALFISFSAAELHSELLAKVMSDYEAWV